jgi:protein-histidine pros-kinase
LIVRPLSRMSRAAEQVSTGDFTVAEFADRGGDEVARLGRAFNRMRRSLQKAMQLMERR